MMSPTSRGDRYSMDQDRAGPTGLPSCTSPGFTVINWPHAASNAQRPHPERWAHSVIRPMQNLSCAGRADERADIASNTVKPQTCKTHTKKAHQNLTGKL